MKNCGVSAFNTYHSVFKTDEWYEVYDFDEDSNESRAVALFADRDEAHKYAEMRETCLSLAGDEE